MSLSSVSSLLSVPLCLFNILNCTSHSRPLLFPLRAALSSETGFPLWVEEKARIHAFFFRARRFRFFSRSFFFALSRSFFRFALASTKARKKRRRPPLGIIQKYVLSRHEMKHFCFIMTSRQEKRAHLFGH